MRWLASGRSCSPLLFFSLYLPFSRAATDRFPNPDDLAGFFGLFFGVSTKRRVRAVAVRDEPSAGPVRGADGAARALLCVVAFGVLAIEDGFATLMVFRFAQVAWLREALRAPPRP